MYVFFLVYFYFYFYYNIISFPPYLYPVLIYSPPQTGQLSVSTRRSCENKCSTRRRFCRQTVSGFICWMTKARCRAHFLTYFQGPFSSSPCSMLFLPFIFHLCIHNINHIHPIASLSFCMLHLFSNFISFDNLESSYCHLCVPWCEAIIGYGPRAQRKATLDSSAVIHFTIFLASGGASDDYLHSWLNAFVLFFPPLSWYVPQVQKTWPNQTVHSMMEFQLAWSCASDHSCFEVMWQPPCLV